MREQEYKQRWIDLLQSIENKTRADAVDILFYQTCDALIQKNRSNEQAEFDGDGDGNATTIARLQGRIDALERMLATPKARYADREFIEEAMNYYGMNYTIVSRTVNRGNDKTRNAARGIPAESSPLSNPVIPHHNHSYRHSTSVVWNITQTPEEAAKQEQRNEARIRDTALAQGHFDSGLRTKSGEYRWNDTPGDGDCTLHAIYETLTAAATEAKASLGITDKDLEAGSEAEALAKASGATKDDDANRERIPSPSDRTAIVVRTEDEELGFKYYTADQLIVAAAQKELAAYDLKDLQSLIEKAHAVHDNYEFLKEDPNAEDSAPVQPKDKQGCIEVLSTYLRVVNHHTDLTKAEAERLVTTSLEAAKEGPQNKDKASVCGLFANIEHVNLDHPTPRLDK
jgi:hypothetical protein